MIIGCYALDLYCHGCNRVSNPAIGYRPDAAYAQFTGNTEQEAKREARRYGWKFINNECYCKNCAKERE